MSLRPRSGEQVPPLTAQIARASNPGGTTAIWVRDRLDGLWCDEDFVGWYPRDGRPGLSPAQLATVCVLQFLLGLSDRQAAEAVRCRIDFKYAMAMELHDPGFHHSVLADFRDRLAADDRADRLLDLTLARLKEAGLVRERTTQRTDSTQVLAAVRNLTRLELITEAVRAALEEAGTWPGIHRLTGRPWVTGTWRVMLSSSPKSRIPAGGNRGPFTTYMTVEQTFWGLHATLRTKESASQSSTATVTAPENSGIFEIGFLYDNRPRVEHQHRSPRHEGACRISFTGLTPRAATGHYYTSRFTAGDMDFTLLNRSTDYATFAEAQASPRSHTAAAIAPAPAIAAASANTMPAPDRSSTIPATAEPAATPRL